MKNQKGITLIALIITIIVILILAVVSFNLVIGNNGIITKTQWAVEADKQGKALEEMTLAWGAFQVDWNLAWANNKDIEFSSFVTKENLQKYIGIYGTIEDVEDNGNGTYTIEYKSNNSDRPYVFIATEDGEVSILDGIKIIADNLSLQVVTDGLGETTKGTSVLKALTTNVSGTINWEITSGSGVVSLSSVTGNQITVTAESGGTAVIKASSSDGSYEDSIEIEVVETTAIQTIGTLSAEQTTINKNGTTTVSTPNLSPANATEILSWTTSNSSIATVTPSADGRSVTVAGVGSGTATITATAINGDTQSIDITVVVPVTGISINETGPIEMSADETTTLSVTLEPNDATNKNVVWSILPNDDSVASLSATSGNSITVSGVSAGNCTVTVTSENGGFTDSINITVTAVAIHPTDQSIPNSSTSIATNYGTIDVIWLDTSNNVVSNPNAPNLYNNSLEKVTWTKSGDTWTEDSTPQSTWYSYNAVSTRNAETNHTDDNNSSMWANAKNPTDGSYFVWIPRYAYRITYYSSETSTTPTGYYDGWGMWKAEDGSVKYALDSGIETVEYDGNKYIVHPAFETNLNNGGWSTDLSGIWVSKYEMSQEKSTDSGTTWNTVNTSSNSIGNILTKNAGNSNYIRAVSKPSTSATTVSSWRNISVGNCYTNAYGYDRDKESHLMKNSEWGAVAYLTHSQYGRNGNEIDINNSSDYLTGNGGGAVGGTASTSAGITNYYNTTLGAKASTTGNVYGIYDVSGGAWEYTASWDSAAADSSNFISSYGSSFASKGGASTKYATAYSNGTSSYSGSKAYEVSKIGDAIKETLNGSNSSKGWFSDYANFAYSSLPFFIRGGDCTNGATAGVFCSGSYYGGYTYYCSFRAVLGR